MVPFHHSSCTFNLYHFSGPILCQEFPSHPLPPAPPREILPVLLGLDHISPAKAFLSYLLDGIAPSTAFPHFSYILCKVLTMHQALSLNILHTLSLYLYLNLLLFPLFHSWEKQSIERRTMMGPLPHSHNSRLDKVVSKVTKDASAVGLGQLGPGGIQISPLLQSSSLTM